MKWFVIRRKKDRAFYCKIWNHTQTGSTLPRHMFSKTKPPFLFSSYNRADHATMTNHIIQTQDCEILAWSDRNMKVVTGLLTSLQEL